MDTMQFRDFLFRHNPEQITVTDAARLKEDFCPGLGSRVRRLGQRARRVRCHGSFLGASPEEAFEQAAELRRAAAGGQAGMLFLPGMEPFPARLEEFVAEAGGDGRILPYTLTFVERGDAEL